MDKLIKIVIIFILACICFILYSTNMGRDKDNTENILNDKEEIISVSAEVKDLKIEHNITDKGKSGMYFYFRQHYNNLKNSTCYYMIRFFDEEGKQLKGKQYQDEDGYFAIIGKIVPDDNDFENIQRPFIAYDQFDVPNKGVVYFYCDVQLFVLDRKGKRVELAHSDPNRFHLSY